MSAAVFVAAFLLAAAGAARAGEGDAAAEGLAAALNSDDARIDKMVKEAFLDSGNDFASNYAALNGLSLTAEEAVEIAARVRGDRKATASALEMAAKLKDRLAACPSTAGQKVTNFVGESDANSQLSHLLQNWHCPDDGFPNKKVESNEVDSYVKYFSKLQTLLKANPGAAMQTALAYLHGKGWISRDIMPIAQMLAGYLEGAPEKLEYLTSAFDYFEKFVGTESGRRALRAVPKLATASADEALEIFKREADFNQEIFFSLMANSDLAENFLKKVARRLINGIQYCKSLLEDDLKFAILNSVFISNNVPPLNRRNLLKSSMDTFERLTHKYTPFIEATNYYESVRRVQEEIEKDYFRFEDLSRLSDEEMENALGGFLEDNFVSPARDAWLANRQVTSGSPRCAPQLACLYSRSYRGQGPIVRWIARAFASTLRYFWVSSHDNETDAFMDRATLEAAAERGWEEESKCDYEPRDSRGKVMDCDVFTLYREKKLMSIRYEHNEL